jgi:hypothetical protein
MNKKIMNSFGFDKEVKSVEMGQCPFCKEKINMENFEDELSLKEFKISGLCQSCQNKFFK